MSISVKTVGDLKHNPKNPRTITDAKLKQLKKSVMEFGDLGCLVFNRTTGNLVGGHQRQKIFTSETPIEIEQTYKRPTRTGTVAEGFVLLDGERFRYREVVWDEAREKAATIAANKSAGEWDMPVLSEWLTDLDDFAIDLDLTMFDELERKKVFKKTKKTTVGEHERSVSGGKELDKEEFDNFEHLCPRCGFEFDKKPAS